MKNFAVALIPATPNKTQDEQQIKTAITYIRIQYFLTSVSFKDKSSVGFFN